MTYEATRALVKKVALRLEGKFTNQPATEAAIRMALWNGFLADRNFRAGAEQAQRAFEIRHRLFGPEHLETLASLRRFGYAKYHSGARSEGLQLMTNALTIVRNGTNAFSKEAGNVLINLGNLLESEGLYADAIVWMSEGLAIHEAIDPKSFLLKTSRAQLANVTALSGDTQKAENLWRQNYEQCIADHGPEAQITLQQQFGLGRILILQKRWQEALPLLEGAAASFQAQIGATNSWTLQVQYWLVATYVQKEDFERAVALATELYPKLARLLPWKNSINFCVDIAEFFRERSLYDEARKVHELLRVSFEKNPPAYPEDVDRFVVATAATKGWAAVAKMYRTYPGWVDRDPAFQRNMASAFLYGDDPEGSRQIVTNALARALMATNIDEQRRFVDIVGLGRGEFSSDEINLCEKLLSLAGTNTVWHRPMAALLLRLGRFEGAIQRLDLALAEKLSALERARLLMLKAICLSQSDEPAKARTAFDDAEALMKDRLLARLPKEEGFIDHDERAYLIHRREAQALLTEKKPK